MATEEQEISLVVECDDLSAFEFGHDWEERLEQPPDGNSEPGDETIQDELGIVRRRPSVPRNLSGGFYGGELEICGRPIW